MESTVERRRDGAFGTGWGVPPQIKGAIAKQIK